MWLLSGYAIAWASELSSIHNGFPYGEYHYFYENLNGELLVAGVPFFDSLSYTFLIFAGFTMAEYILGPRPGTRDPGPEKRFSGLGFRVSVLGAFLTMMLDVIVDPIATMGDKWFLGKIHFYAHPGFYFGVPLTNFAGWFLVSFVVIGFNTSTWAFCPFFFGSRVSGLGSRVSGLGSRVSGLGSRVSGLGSRKGVIFPAFYFSIALFNIAVTFWTGEWWLGLASSIIFFLLAILSWTFHKQPVS